MKHLFITILTIVLSISCNSMEANYAPQNGNLDKESETINSQIKQYVIHVFEDSKENLWLGVFENGVTNYNGKTLIYFTQ